MILVSRLVETAKLTLYRSIQTQLKPKEKERGKKPLCPGIEHIQCIGQLVSLKGSVCVCGLKKKEGGGGGGGGRNNHIPQVNGG